MQPATEEQTRDSDSPHIGNFQRGSVFALAGLRKAPMGNDAVIAHIHVPKCGGTSVRMMMAKYFGAGHLSLYDDDTLFIYSEAQLADYLRAPSVRAFSSHFVREFPPAVAGRRMLYITFLRDPIEQFISYLTYVRKHFSEIHDDHQLAMLPPDLPALSSRKIARWILTSPVDIHFRENYTTEFFARYVFRRRYAKLDGARYHRSRLDLARSVLDRFFFVGITERLGESVSALQMRAQNANIDFPPGAVGRENVSADFRDDLSWIHPDDEVGAMLFDSVREDRQLYEWAAARFEAAIAPTFTGVVSPIERMAPPAL